MFSLKTMLRTGMAIVVLAAISSLLTYNLAVRAQSITPSTAPVRHFYLRKTVVDGSHVLGSCATGFHVASIWELHEPALLTYSKSLGATNTDDGNGPPTSDAGWARTGYSAWPGNDIGRANCGVWTSNSSADYGTVIFLQLGGSVSSPVDPWGETSELCSGSWPVWCVEN